MTNLIYVLGPICKNGHDHESSGQSLRYSSTRQCIACMRERAPKYRAENPQVSLKAAKKHYHKNRSRRLGEMAEYRKRDAFKASQRKHRAANKESLYARTRAWKAENRAAVREAERAWRSTPQGRAITAAIRHRRRASMRGNECEPYTAEQLIALFNQHGGRCVYCGDEADSVDHVIPVSRGGPDALRNLAPACRPCNASKGNRLLCEWAGRLVG